MASRFLEVETEAGVSVPCPRGCSWTEPCASPPDLAEKRALGIYPDAWAVPRWLESPAKVQTQLYWNCSKTKQMRPRWECCEASELSKCLLSGKTGSSHRPLPCPSQQPSKTGKDGLAMLFFQRGKPRHREDTQPGLGACPVDSNSGHCFPRPLPTHLLRGPGSWGRDFGSSQQLQPFCLESWTKGAGGGCAPHITESSISRCPCIYRNVKGEQRPLTEHLRGAGRVHSPVTTVLGLGEERETGDGWDEVWGLAGRGS